MHDHDIRLIEIGQKEGYDRAVKEIAADLKTLVDERDRLKLPKSTTAIIRQCAARIEAKFGGRDGQ